MQRAKNLILSHKMASFPGLIVSHAEPFTLKVHPSKKKKKNGKEKKESTSTYKRICIPALFPLFPLAQVETLLLFLSPIQFNSTFQGLNEGKGRES